MIRDASDELKVMDTIEEKIDSKGSSINPGTEAEPSVLGI
jgi:hypothetical protein